MSNILEILKNQEAFLIALTICVLCNTICGGLKHTKLSDFNWKELLIGALRFIAIVVVILLMTIAIEIYQPLYAKISSEFEALKIAIVIAFAIKVITQIKDYYSITDEEVEEASTYDSGKSNEVEEIEEG